MLVLWPFCKCICHLNIMNIIHCNRQWPALFICFFLMKEIWNFNNERHRGKQGNLLDPEWSSAPGAVPFCSEWSPTKWFACGSKLLPYDATPCYYADMLFWSELYRMMLQWKYATAQFWCELYCGMLQWKYAAVQFWGDMCHVMVFCFRAPYPC